jgi:leucyl aminopeptidase (aminopeptidase T)
MTLDMAPKMARVITEHSTAIREGDYVVIMGGVAAAPLVEALYEAVLARGGHPSTHIQLPDSATAFRRPRALTRATCIGIWYTI